MSVIIPFLDGSAWLKEAIDSVIQQTVTNWELILIDDGSAFEATSLALDFAKAYPGKIFYLEHPGHLNKGVSISRNLGVESSKGSLVAFLDSDDKWLPRKLERQLRIFEEQKDVTVVCEASIFWYSWNDPSEDDKIIYVGAEGDRVYPPGSLLKKLYPFGTGAPPCPTGIIMRKSAFEHVGGFEAAFAAPYQLYEDQALLVKLYISECVYISAQANNLYRKRTGSLTGAGEDRGHYEMVRKYFFEWFGEKFSLPQRRREGP